jgi:microsomal dipeptidase-like Zn-dependent dipeptidase
MPDLNFSIDLHRHPQYKAFARAHKVDGDPPEAQSSSASNRSSLWYYDPPSPIDKLLNIFLSVTKFSQTNFTASLYGRSLVMAAGLGSVEKPFFKNKLGTGIISDLIDDFAAGFGRPRINAIQAITNYWEDFMNEMRFMDECENNPVRIDNHWYTYRLPKNFAELQQIISANEDVNAGTSRNTPIIISVICAVEGLHILNCGLESPCDPAEVKQHAKDLKNLAHAPWFVTFSHHFYNELCGHSRSLRHEIGKVTDQENGINSGFTPLGEEVLDILLDDTNNDRILVDVKHMSPIARKRFYDIRRTKYNSDIPIIMSHGVANGLPTYGATVSDFPELGNTFINPTEDVIGGDGRFKDHNVINFYDDEIIQMVQSAGIIGLQLDERRLANDNAIRHVKHSLFRNKIMHYRSELVWKQIQYIAELLDKNGLYAWGNMAIGSDYDGLVDPLNAFWTAEEFDDLAGYLERHAYNYLNDHPERLGNSMNKISADVVIQNIFRDNAWNFLRTWF